MSGFFKVNRADATRELLRERNAWALLSLIAYRAKRTSVFSTLDLKPGEALVGDPDACGLTEQEYRTAKAKLAKWGFATFRATRKGTVATLVGTDVFDVNVEDSNGHANTSITDGQRPSNGQSTTNKKDKNEYKNYKKGEGPRMFVSELKDILDAKKKKAAKMKAKYAFEYQAERDKHPSEYAEYQNLWKEIKEVQEKIEDFPI